MFRKLMATGLLLSARGRLPFFLNQPGPNWTRWVNTLSPRPPKGPASQLNSTAGGPASPPSALLAVSTPRSLPWGRALSAPGSSSQKPGLAPGWPPPGPSLPAALPVGHKASLTAGFSLTALGLLCLLCPFCLLSPCSWEPACPTRLPPGTQAPDQSAFCWLLCLGTHLPPAGLPFLGLQAAHGDRGRPSTAQIQHFAWSSGPALSLI